MISQNNEKDTITDKGSIGEKLNPQSGTTLDSKNFDKLGRLVRPQSLFRNFLSKDEGAQYLIEPGRYHLYICLACPWANACYQFLLMKGLQEFITVSTVKPEWGIVNSQGRMGWIFDKNEKSQIGLTCEDSLYGLNSMYEIYLTDSPDYKERITVPVLWDKKTKTIVNNESSEIIKMFNKDLDEFSKNKIDDIYPGELQKDIDDAVSWIYPNIQNGVYKCGFAQTQVAYNEAFIDLFKALDRVEDILENHQYLVGDKFTFIDLRIFMCLIRFDPVYYVHFKCNKRMIQSYQNISRYIKHLYHQIGLGKTCDMDHIKRHYYGSHPSLNPKGIVPLGPNPWWESQN